MILYHDQLVYSLHIHRVNVGNPITGAIKKNSRRRNSRLQFRLYLQFFRTKRIAMNGVNEKTAESHEANSEAA